MKKVLLTTTAVALTAGMASAGDMSMSGSISLTYGGFGTGSAPAAAKEEFSSEADLNIAASSSSGSISMSGTLEIDEDGAPSAGPVVLSSGAFSLTYDKNDVGGGLLKAMLPMAKMITTAITQSLTLLAVLDFHTQETTSQTTM